MLSLSPAPIEVRQAWTRATLAPRHWLVPVPEACRDELEVAIAQFRLRPRPVETLSLSEFALSASAGLMRRVRDTLTSGEGLVVLDRLPVERHSAEENRALGFLLASLLGPVVAQKWDGTRVYDVMDSGQPLGHGVRRSVTNLAQPFHTDGGWLPAPPEFVGLLCLEEAEQGGLSRFVSLVTAHERLRESHPELLDRLYRPFWWDRQAEHAPDDSRVSARPTFEVDGGGLSARYYEDYVLKGQTLAGESLDAAGAVALRAMRALVDQPAHWVELRMEKGQFQYLNNRRLAHSRTGFVDSPGAPRRHMLRFWNRDEGTIDLEGR
jgi:alpha-ketoglutarate-dependent taurine dioxygenase